MQLLGETAVCQLRLREIWDASLIGPILSVGSRDAPYCAPTKRLQSFVTRLESGAVTPKWETLNRYARTTGMRLRIEFDVVFDYHPY